MDRFNAFWQQIQADAALIHKPENMRWLSGYTGEGCLFIGRQTRAILTDFRYFEQVGRQAPGWTLVKVTNDVGYPAQIAKLAGDCGARSMQVETDFLTVDGYRAISDALAGVELLPVDGIPERLREIKDEAEQASILRAGAIASEAFVNILPRVHAGMTERQVQRMLENEMLELGSEAPAFNTIAAAGPNGALPHAIPSDRPIESGELLTLDFGAMVDGYRSDVTRTVGFGKVSAELREIYETVRTAQQLGLDTLAVGKPCREVDRTVRDYVDARYPGAFGHGLGHGVGLMIHELPRLSTVSTAVLAPGHVVTMEPGVYIPGLGGCRIEDTVIMTETGVINIISAPKQLIEL